MIIKGSCNSYPVLTCSKSMGQVVTTLSSTYSFLSRLCLSLTQWSISVAAAGSSSPCVLLHGVEVLLSLLKLGVAKWGHMMSCDSWDYKQVDHMMSCESHVTASRWITRCHNHNQVIMSHAIGDFGTDHVMWQPCDLVSVSHDVMWESCDLYSEWITWCHVT